MAGNSAYQSKLINFMLIKEKVFIQFRSCYYLLYQCLVPNSREALSLLVQHYSVPKDFERTILLGGNPRVCNQGLFNYLLIMLRRDRNFVKFWTTLKAMTNNPELRIAIDKLQNKMSSNTTLLSSPKYHYVTSYDNTENMSSLPENALSVTDSDDDYCVGYIVTMVNVRSCSRPPRLLDQQHISEDPHMPTPPKSLDHFQYPGFAELQSHYSVLVRSMPDDYMNTVSQLEHHLTGDHIGSILECTDVFTANQRLLDCLIAQLEGEKDAFDLCNWLSVIHNAPVLNAAIEDFKKDVIIGIKRGTTSSITTVDAEASLCPNDLSQLSLKTPTKMPEPDIFRKLYPEQFGPKALAILKKHYHALWMSLPDDHLITLTVLSDEAKNLNPKLIQAVTALRSPEHANQLMLDYIIFILSGDQQMMTFCDLMEKMINNPALSKIISALRTDCQSVMFDNWFKSLLMPQIRTSNSDGHPGSQSDLENVFDENVTTESRSAGDGYPQQYGGDIGPSVIDHLPVDVSAHCRTMLHRYYDTLWQSFPQDHLITLSRLCDLIPVEERLVETIALYPTSEHDVANRRILNAALSNVKRDNELLGFCLLVEKLISSPRKAKITEKMKSDCMLVMQKKATDSIGPSLVEQNEDEVEDIALITDEPIEDDSMALYFCSPKITANCIAMLRRHYKCLVGCLPDNHFVTLSALSNIIRFNDFFFDKTLNCTNSKRANKNILNLLIMMLIDDKDISGFCKVLRDVIGSKSLTAGFLQFQMECVQIVKDAATAKTNEDDSPSSYVANSASPKQCRNLMSLALQEIKHDISPRSLVVIKKYCNFFWKSFPKDYSVTLARFCEASSRKPEDDENIATCPNLEMGNLKILTLCMAGLVKDDALMIFGAIMKDMIDNPKLSKIFAVFKQECKMAIQKALLSSSSSSSSSMINSKSSDDDSNVSTITTSHTISSSDTQPTPSTAAITHVKAVRGATPAGIRSNRTDDRILLMIIRLLPSTVSDDVILVLRKYYSNLADSFFDDHITTMGILQTKFYVKDTFFSDIISMTDHKMANQRMLNALMILIQADNQMMNFCGAVLDLCSRDKFCDELVEFTKECRRITDKAKSVPSIISSSTLATAGADKKSEPKVLTILSTRQLSSSGVSVVREHYYSLLKDFPSDHMNTLNMLSQYTEISDRTVDRIISCCTPQEGNETVLEYLILDIKSNSDLVEFSDNIERIVGDDSTTLKSFRNDCLKVLNHDEESKDNVVHVASTANVTTAVTSPQHSLAVENVTTPVITISSATDDTKAALRTFDEHLYLMTLIEPCCIEEKLHTAGLVSGSTDASLSGISMEKLLEEIRSCININGAKMFLAFVELLQSEGRYVLFASHIFNKYHSYGGQGVLIATVGSLPLASATIPIAEMLDQLSWHRKQLQAGLQYQDPMPIPHHYVQRHELLDSIVTKLIDKNFIQSAGTTVNISGIGGIGKSTLAKALCHDVRLRSYFLDGFLLIRLGPLPVSPAIKLGQIYHLLTNKTEVGNQTFFTDKLQTLVAEHLYKLLVIIDDVWEVSDALVYTQVFNGCKIVMTTHRENVNKLIPSKMCITVEQMSKEEAIELLTHDLPKEFSPDKVVLLAQNLHYCPLLLKLMHSYLHVCCNEQHKTLPQAINCVQEVLKDKGLKADKHEGAAVVAMIQSTEEMLNTDEVDALQKMVLSIGFSMPIPVKLLPAILKLSEEDVKKLCRRLLQLGLISNCQLMTAPNNKAIPCYEVHPIIAQYVVDHMTFESSVKLVDTSNLGDIKVISTMFAGGDDSNVSYHCLATIATIDIIVVPCYVRLLFALIKNFQHEIKSCTGELSKMLIRNNKVDLVHEVLSFKENDTIKQIDKLYNVIIEDWRKLYALLVDNKHDQAIECSNSYVKSHPLQMELTNFIIFINGKLDQCKDNQSLVTDIRSHTDQIVQFYKNMLNECTEHVRINLRRDLVAVINSGNVTSKKYQHLISVHDKGMCIDEISDRNN